ncbi:hypothetical protein [Nocardioides houyundeii]|uniref:hypothetical protein n=1 Tax=Nocardioides houyundeii TaxID=2045452 RepID=UPI000DF15BCE|nr:hypothetical protein [Nocardioides houyundeii]
MRDVHVPLLTGWLVLLVAGCAVAVTTGQPLLLVLAVLGAGVTAYAGTLGWRLSFVVVLLGALVAEVLFTLAAPHVGWTLGTDNLVAWTAVGVVHVVLASRQVPQLDRRQLVDLVACTLTQVLVSAYLLWTAFRAANPWLGWAMTGDAANNMILNRQFVLEGGLLRSQGNAAPLATVLHGSWASPSVTEGSSASEVVRQVVLGGSQMSLLLFMAVGVAASLIAIGKARPGGHRILVGAVAGTFPWLWYSSGYAFQHGFQNSAPTMLMLLLTWECWLAQARRPVGTLTGLVLATWAIGMSWGPVAVVPAFLMLAMVVRQRKALKAAGRALLLPGGLFLAALVYAYLVTLPDLRTAGGLPAFDGGHPLVDASRALWFGIAACVGVLVLYRRLRPEVPIGVLVAAPAVALGVAQLMLARRGAEELWGYYPIKFAWLVLATAVVVLFAELIGPLQRWAGRWWGGAGVVPAFACAFAVMFLISAPWRPMTLGSVFTPVALHDNVANDRALDHMFDVMEEHRKTILAAYSTGPLGPNEDGISNFWLLQSGLETINDPIHTAAYYLDPTSPESICSAANIWGGGVRVLTRDPALGRKVERRCAEDLDVEVLAP